MKNKRKNVMTKSLIKRINEINQLSAQVEQFDCDFQSTITGTYWNLSITYSDKFVWIKSDGILPMNNRFTLLNQFDIDDLKWNLTQLKKSINREIIMGGTTTPHYVQCSVFKNYKKL